MKKNLILLLLFPVLVFGFGSLVEKKIDTIVPPSGTLTLENTIILDGSTGNSVPYLNPSKEITSSTINQVELEQLEGVTQNIQDAFETFKIDIQDNMDLIGTTSQDLQGQIDLATQDIADNTALIGTTSQDLQLQINSATQDIDDNTTLIGTTSQDLQTNIDGKVSLTGNETVLGNKTFSGTTSFTNTDAIAITKGTTAQRPAGTSGLFRYNSDEETFEGYTTEWGPIAGSGGDFATTLLDNIGGVPVPGSASTYSAVPTGASSTVTITADNNGVTGDSITVTGAAAGAPSIEGDFNPSGNGDTPYGFYSTRTATNVFPAPSSFNISRVDVFIKRDSGAIAANLNVDIQNALQSGTFAPTGAVVATSITTVDSSTVSDVTGEYVSFYFDPAIALTSGTYYAINIRNDGPTPAARTRNVVSSNQTGLAAIAGGCDEIGQDCTNPSNWSMLSIYHPQFKIYSGGAGNKDIDTLIGEWNGANGGNTATVNAGGSESPDIGIVVSLSGGVDDIAGGDTSLNAGLFPDTASTYDIGSTQSAWNVGVFETVLISDGVGGYEELSASVDLDLSAVTQNIIADTTNTRNIGTSLIEWAQGYFDDLFTSTITSPNGQDLSIVTEPVSGNTNDINIQTGVAVIAGDSGNLSLSTGAASGGTQGVINLTAPTINVTGNIPSIDTGKIEVTSTTEGSSPCPKMTTAQMEAVVSPGNMDCVFNTTDNAQYNYDLDLTEWVISGSIVNVENITDWTAYTPSNTQGYGTISTVELYYRRVGDSVEIRGRFTAGTVTGSEAQIGLPTGLTIDSSKSGAGSFVVGKYLRNITDVSIVEYSVLATGGDTFLNVSRREGISLPLNPAAGNGASGTSGVNSFFATVPIQGWSASTKYATGKCTGLECFNEFSARISNNGTATLTSENLSGVFTDVTRTALGFVRFNYASLGLSTIPAITVTSSATTNGNPMISSINTTQAIVHTANNIGTASVDYDFDLILQRQGSDFFDHDERFIEVTDGAPEFYKGSKRGDADGFASTNTSVTFFLNEESNTISKYGTIDNNSTLGWSFTASRNVDVSMTWCAGFNIQGWFGIARNSTNLSGNVSGSAAAEVLGIGYASTATGNDCVSYNGPINSGDVIRAQTDSNISNVHGNDGSHSISMSIKPLSIKAYVGNLNPKTLVETPGSDKPKMYSFKVSSSGVVSNEIGDLVNGNCTNAATSVCTFNSGKFTGSDVVCTVGATTDVDYFCMMGASSTSGSLYCRNHANTTVTTTQGKQVICFGE